VDNEYVERCETLIRQYQSAGDEESRCEVLEILVDEDLCVIEALILKVIAAENG